MKHGSILKTIPAVLVMAALSVAPAGTALFAAAEAEEPYADGFVYTPYTETQEGFTVFANNKEAGGVTVTLGEIPFTKEYFALELRASYALAEDGLLPVRFYANERLLGGAPLLYDREGNSSAAETDEDGYLALKGGFEGFVYFAKSCMEDVSVLTSVRAEFDGVHRGELTILNVFQCVQPGLKPHEGGGEADLTVTAENGAAVSDGFAVSYAGGEENGSVDAQFKTPAAFNEGYLVFDITTTSEVYAALSVNDGNALGASEGAVSYLSKKATDAMQGMMQLQMQEGSVVFPADFDGLLCFDKAEIGEPDRVEGFRIELDKAHPASFTVNGVYATDTPISFISTDRATISETTVENFAGSNDHVVSVLSNTSLFDRSANYLAVKFRMLTLASDIFTYLRFIVNGEHIAGDTDAFPDAMLPAYPADGSDAILLQHHWGNWIVIPQSFDGVIYIPMTQLALKADPTLFGFGFDEGHMTKFEYAIGTADVPGGACVWTDLSAKRQLADLQAYRSPDVAGISSLSSFETDRTGKITDRAVVCDSGISAFGSYSHNVETFGGVSLGEAWENELAVHIKSQAEGGVPATIPDDGDDFGNLEFDLGENAFDMASGLALNVQCLSEECYFRVYVMDEGGYVWSADFTGSYLFVSDEVPVGMETQFFNFYFNSGAYGTLFIPKERFNPETSYCGREIAAGEEMGRVKKIIFSFDMQYGLGRTMAVGAMANVDVEGNTITRVCMPAQMTEEQLGIGTAQGTAVSCPGTEKHIANFTLRRVGEEEVPGVDHSVVDNGIILVATKKEPPARKNGCHSSAGFLLPVACAVAVLPLKRKKNIR